MESTQYRQLDSGGEGLPPALRRALRRPAQPTLDELDELLDDIDARFDRNDLGEIDLDGDQFSGTHDDVVAPVEHTRPDLGRPEGESSGPGIDLRGPTDVASTLDLDDALADLPEPVAPAGFVRDGRGAWFTADGAQRAAWLHDLRLADVWQFEHCDGDVLVPTLAAHADPALDWVRDYPATRHTTVGSRTVAAHAVPDDIWDRHAQVRVDATGAHLDVRRVCDTHAVAELCGLSVATVRTYLSRDAFPTPVAYVAGSPCWTLPQILTWEAERRAPGERRR